MNQRIAKMDLRNEQNIECPRCRLDIKEAVRVKGRLVTVQERFWARVFRGELNMCWLWAGAKRGSGYGNFRLGRKISEAAHRVSWVIHFGHIPEGLCVLHRCDVRLCVNPAHLFLGTRQDNTNDMHQKGRGYCGSHSGVHNGNAKLTEQQVREIREKRASGIETRFLVAEYGMARTTIQQIVSKRIWKEVI